MFVIGRLVVIVVLFLQHGLINCQSEGEKLIGDQSGFVSVAFRDGEWNLTAEYLDWDEDHSIIARANFTNAQTSSGWMFLEVQTRESAPDQLQAQAAGIAEGYLTRISIIERFKESFTNGICSTEPKLCNWVEEIFVQNEALVGGKINQLAQNDPYWHQVNLFYLQMEGLKNGLKLRADEDPRPEDEGMNHENGIMLLNFIADFWDLKEQYALLSNTTQEQKNTKTNPGRPSCTVIIKFLEDQKDILVAHNTWHIYQAMSYKFLKNYDLNYHVLPGSSSVIPGHKIAMSSYAGALFSEDDYYLTSAGLAATETSLFIYDKNIWKNLSPEGVVYEPIRVMVANRLSEHGSQWAKTFEKHNSGTYNNQWMIIDYKKLAMEEIPTEGVLTVLEQIPDLVVIEDQTKLLLTRGYWKSYNRAFYPEIFQKTGAPDLVYEFGDWFTYNETPRSKIIDRDHSKIHDISSLMKVMRYNDFKNDPEAQIRGCGPEPNAAGSLANRLDLNDPKAKCTFADHDNMVGFKGYGALDAKMASKYSFPGLNFTAVAGPTHDQHPPFSWSKTSIPDEKPTFLPIDTFDFEPFDHTWVMNGQEPKFMKKSSWLQRIMVVNLVLLLIN